MAKEMTPERCKREVLRYLPKRFGIPVELLDSYYYLWRGGSIWMTSIPIHLVPVHWSVQRVGIRALRKVPEGWKPTTPLLQFFAPYITENRVVLNEEQWRRLLQGQALDCLREEILTPHLTPGYVALALGELLIGCGYFTGRFLRHQLSGVRAMELAKALGVSFE